MARGPRFSNIDRLTVKLNAIGKETGRLVGRAVLQSAQAVADNYAERVTNPPKSGRLYKRGKKWHQASAPGEAPARDTGRLSQSATAIPTVSGPDRYVAEAGANAPQATRLELGGYSIAKNGHGTPKKGPGRVYIAPRPAMGPAFKEEKPKAVERIEKAIIKGARSR